ncbi:winged helix-turn-helix domain-containing protein [Herbaspirillum frisingense]|uniref:winged helix-turn-helix domain-containing protein n=1 Tax=Herbaspirillum frisingense TaxID=92645 RepID=UPI001F21EB38|nr:winged helix-turn-helix domain-containing protein [Herbaspirillum frisingense]UIN22250.1 winged helix-turn-helix domain-containing protein [Herbaspirillum frisingense]
MPLRLNSRGIPTWRGTELDLPPKERAVLTQLIQNSPDPVSKDAIIQHAWMGDRSVSDDSLVRCISQLRKALPDAKIESVYGYGYRLLLARDSTGFQPVPSTNASMAHEQFLHASMLAQQHSAKPLKQAISVFRSITLTAPNFAPAKIGLAKTITTAMAIGLDSYVGVSQAEAIEHLEAAAVLVPDSPDLLSAQAWLRDSQWRFREARAMHIEALRMAPDNADALLFYGLHLSGTGRPEEAIGPLRRLLILRPYSIQIRAILARTLGMLNRYAEAMEEIAIAEDHDYAGSSPALKGVKIMVSAAFEPTQRLAQIAEKLSSSTNIPPYARINLPYVLAQCGLLCKARNLVQERLQSCLPNSPEGILMVKDLVAIGEMEQAAERLLGAFTARFSYLPLFLQSPELAPLLTHPAVEKAYREMYQEVWQERGAPSVIRNP